MTLVRIEKADGIATVTLDRPEAMNALSSGLQRELAAAFLALDRDEAVRVIILTGAGTRAFTAGLDLKELGRDATMIGRERSVETDPILAIEACRKPVIGAINGVAITGGFELALTCDILIAADTARFADTHGRVGVMPGWGLSQKLSRVIGIYRAKELSLSGNFLDAATAADWGLVNRVVPADQLLVTAHRLAADIASADPVMVRRYKAVIDEGYALPFGEAKMHERAVADGINEAVSPESVAARREGVQARGRGQ